MVTRKEIEGVKKSEDGVGPEIDFTSGDDFGSSIKKFGHTLERAVSRMSSGGRYDIFLSHSSSESTLVNQVKLQLEGMGFSVYKDSPDESLKDCHYVDEHDVLQLQEMMMKCKTLLYLHTEKSSHSRWCSWELGFFNGRKGNDSTYVFPLTEEGMRDSRRSSFDGQEYLLIYPVVWVDALLESKGSRSQLRGGTFESSYSKSWSISSIVDREI